MENKKLEVQNLYKQYTDKVGYTINLLENISFVIEDKKFTSIIAPVGSGKTSLLRILADLDEPSNGSIDSSFNKKIYIPSLPSSFPWLSVEDNIKINSGMDAEEISKIVELVELKGYEDHFPHNKSEGFRFRISLGRTLAVRPDLIIIDEPFNNLNTETKKEIYLLLHKIQSKLSIAIVLGTTNITESIFLSNTVYMMKKNPGQVIEKISIDLPEHRNLETMDSEKFINIRSQIENVFRHRADRQLYNFSI